MFIKQMHINRYINVKSVILIIPGVTLDNTIDTRALTRYSFLKGESCFRFEKPTIRHMHVHNL